MFKIQVVFKLYDTYGFPPEVTSDLAHEQGLEIDMGEFEKLFKEHQEKSRMGSEQKFKGGLADQSPDFYLHINLVVYSRIPFDYSMN